MHREVLHAFVALKETKVQANWFLTKWLARSSINHSRIIPRTLTVAQD